MTFWSLGIAAELIEGCTIHRFCGAGAGILESDFTRGVLAKKYTYQK